MLQYLREIWSYIDIAVVSFAMAFLMALVRTAQQGKADILEALTCGLFAIGVWSCMSWFNLPEVYAVGIASAIGHLGSHWIADKIRGKVK